MDLAPDPSDALIALITVSSRVPNVNPWNPVDVRDHPRRRQEQRLGRLRRRAALASALGFAAFLALAAQHAVGSNKGAARSPTSPPVAAPTTYFDQRADGFSFDDGSSVPPPPPVAQTNVS